MTLNFGILLKAIGALLIATIVSPSFAGELTVHSGKRYRATLSLNAVERLTDNALIARKFRAMGFSKVRVSGAGAVVASKAMAPQGCQRDPASSDRRRR